jgi:hypothetical protein
VRTAGLSFVVSPCPVGCHVIVVSRFLPSTSYFIASDSVLESNRSVVYPWSIPFDIFLLRRLIVVAERIVSQDVGVGVRRRIPLSVGCRVSVSESEIQVQEVQVRSRSESEVRSRSKSRSEVEVRGRSPFEVQVEVRGLSPRSKSVRGPSRGPRSKSRSKSVRGPSPRSKFEVRGPSQVRGPSPCPSPSPVQVQVSVCVPCRSVGRLVVGLSESLRHAAPRTCSKYSCSSKILKNR